MCIDLRSTEVIVAKQFLHRTDVGAAFQQVCGKGVTKRVGVDFLSGETRLAHGYSEVFTDNRIVEMMAT